MMALTLAACSGGSGSNAQEANGDQPPEKLTNLTYWVQMVSQVSATLKSYNEIEAYKELEKVTGVKVDFQHPPEGQQAKEQFNLMLTSDKLPDVIEYSWTSYPGGPEKAIKDGKIIRLNELIDEHAPNLKKVLGEHPEWKKEIMTDEGSIYAFPFIRSHDRLKVFLGPTIRQDWLDKLNLEMPATIDEWYTVLKAFKENDMNGNGKADEIPLYLAKGDVDASTAFLGAFGINAGFYQEGGTVKYGPTAPRFKEFLTLMNTWYQEGLLDRDFATTDAKLLEAKITGGQIGAAVLYTGSGIGNYNTLMKDKDPNFHLVAAPYPVMNKGDKQIWGYKDFAYTGIGAAVTTSNKNPVETVKWLDYAYSEEGTLLFNFGKEGVSYTMENGKPVFKPEVMNDPSGLPLIQSMSQHNRATFSGPFMLDIRFDEQYTTSPDQLKSKEIWAEPTLELKLPRTTPNSEESSRYASIMNDINTFKDEMYLKFIMGQEPLDNFDKYVKTIEGMGLQEAIQIQQNALERYNQR
ncbi:extracellular solute-binding protein [Paenibacillus thiaminolyticus]|uniref:Extracellular solute-binding protein n=1 Tax=Paenibacillus thiaminolyticus TaxID=49283 RepID=A0AAP9E0N8_PANTH|nr:extracellular solute-binding protein [Paenibacillus thiaminolyticus]MCY9537796.1 extracellular solute-binding protein [Paenibacillus thiaminolyticus]MCY9601943.1 extracellular solute-binding protein [Paenibacillus thiaminolyticus]MCY9609071.1 extracellular solute-binding protein [Paenibacillus thiaminolyticus]MCY9614722.1 extracellular solute-binding protein [Paenibacillus thiaminolyticus]MCY9621569.1 extracellular solute-binding protein [Paenibacillus thiaminolyticus]